jgi:predicted MPP superfamily phosphohydrolase
MIVSNGCGDWFPCRIGAPAEIGLVRLTKAQA